MVTKFIVHSEMLPLYYYTPAVSKKKFIGTKGHFWIRIDYRTAVPYKTTYAPAIPKINVTFRSWILFIVEQVK